MSRAEVKKCVCLTINIEHVISIYNVDKCEVKCLIPQLNLSLQGLTPTGYEKGIK